MSLRINIGRELSGPTNTKVAKSAAGGCRLVACLLVAVLLFAECPTALSQTPAPTPAKVQVTQLPATAQLSPSPTPPDEGGAAGQTPASTSQTQDPSPASSTQQPDDKGKQKAEKRGSFVIAPIPISSPAFGSGILLIVGYVFKFDKDDDVSPPSAVGMAGAFTSNGTRALALAGQLYLQENKYQTT